MFLRAVMCFTLVTCVVLRMQGQHFVMEGTRKKEVINFIQVKNLIIIPVFINNKGPYNFLLDTGVGQMIITDTAFLKILQIEQAKTIKIQGYGFGKEIEAVLTRNLSARVGRSTMLNIPAAIFKEDIFDLSSYLGIRIYGILGYHFFNSFIIKVNYASNKLTVYSSNYKFSPRGTKVPLRVINAKPYILASIRDTAAKVIPLELMVDNGSSHPLMLESFDEKPFPLPTVTIPANLGVGVNGQINGRMGRVRSLEIEGFEFANVLAGFPDFISERTDIEGTPRNGSLGAEVLKHFQVTFDYQHEAMYLKKTNKFRENFEHDMSGLEIYVRQAKENRYFIGRVEPGSPAEDAGLVEDDEIVAIDFRGMQAYDLDSITELFRDQDGRHLLLEIQRKDQRLAMVLRLKKRI